VALAEWNGGKIAREAKAMAPSAAWWAAGGKGSSRLRYQEILDTSVRCCDPYVKLKGKWIVRRLAPDCTRIELSELPAKRDEARLLRAMGWETANLHLASSCRRVSVHAREWDARRLNRAAREMAQAVRDDWRDWVRTA